MSEVSQSVRLILLFGDRIPGHFKDLARSTLINLDDNRFDHVLRELDLALQIQPGLSSLHAARGEALRLLDRSTEALAAFERAIDLDPNFDLVHAAHGEALLSVGRFKEALAEFNRAIELRPANSRRDYSWLYAAHHQAFKEEQEPISNEITDEILKRPRYDRTMDVASALKAAALSYGLPKNVADAIGDLAAKAMRKNTARSAEKLRLKWGKDRQSGESPAEFIRRAYADELLSGSLHKGVIHSEDRSLYDALFNWLRDPTHKLDFELPTKAEWNSRRIAALGLQEADSPGVREVIRLHDIARKRRTRQPVRTPG